MKFILLYLVSISSVTFILFGIDKLLAIKNKRRIPEKDLLIFSLIGGALGGLLGMIIFNHKISKGSFLWKFLLVLVATIFIIFFLMK
ncbi:DUF1294 domain-containing protein [Flavobacterium oreochromis]|uniref:DUF1294 domain-containing protein n=2 Tax=Flavobacterium TaxID=237 RepID=A0A246G8J5_9FLAO|nr:DUF1294 domain-containing protein [Flavobacterium oreochromis]OWP74966.1 hypothetical protein BWG23_12440 [Flavobacterium oreochromis]OWP75304.1 hypothetical protein BWK62_12245 [Flavobacterium oreochromis]QYS87332.1 DUF1294 domain-containing protein [Flavobacterium oreochromis]